MLPINDPPSPRELGPARWAGLVAIIFFMIVALTFVFFPPRHDDPQGDRPPAECDTHLPACPAVERDGVRVVSIPALPDAAILRLWSDAAGVPWPYTFAIAWRETRVNVSPDVRSWAGAVGRFQIMPATARSRCPELRVTTYQGNLSCFLKMATEDARTCGNDFRCVARIHNGSGPKAERYADSVIADVRSLVRKEIG